VTINGVAAAVTSWGSNEVVANLPNNATTGNIVVTVGGVGSNGVAFNVDGPAITGLSSHIGAVGDSVTVYGTSFGATQADSTVTFNGVSATPTSWNPTTILVPVPAGATTGPIAVTVLSVSSSSPTFTVGPPDTITGLTVSSPANGESVSTPYVAVAGTVTGSISGIDPITITCNNVSARLTAYNFSCNPPLSVGVNSISVIGTDSAGDTASATVSVTLGMAAPISIQVTPPNANMLVGGTQSFTAVDHQGVRRPDATWSVSDSTIASIVTGSQNTLVGNAVGQVTLTATVGGVSGQTTVTVLSGTSLPVGTVLWSATPVSGFTTQQIVQAVPTADGPDLYSVETDPNNDILVRAFKSTGEQMWQSQFGNSLAVFAPVQGVGDNFGGLLLIGSGQNNGVPYGIITDLDGQSGGQAWQYSTSGLSYISFGAVSLDGSIFAIESDGFQGNVEPTYLDSISGVNGGLQSRIELPLSMTYFHCPDETTVQYSGPGFGLAAVAPDGAFYIELSSLQSITESNCEFGPQPFSFNTRNANLSLMRVSPDGGVGFSPLDSSTGPGGPGGGEVIPDGQGGVLATWSNSSNETVMADIGTPGGVQMNFPDFPSGITSMVLGDNGTAFATDGHSVVAFNVPSLAPTWTYGSGGGQLSFVAATSNGGVAVDDSQQGIIQLDSSGTASAPVAGLQGAQYFGNGLWVGVEGDPVMAELQGNLITWAGSVWNFPFGNTSGGRTQSKYDFELNWCANGLCSSMKDPGGNNAPDQDVSFSITGNDPPHNTINLTPSQIKVIQLNAVNAFKLAFKSYNVNVGAGRQGTNTVYVVGQAHLGDCGGTGSLVYSSSVVYYQVNAIQAQYAIGDTAGTPTQAMLQALGEGIGNNAAHEIAHELVNALSTSGKIIKNMDLDDASTGTYNSASCDGSDAPWVYTGIGTNGAEIYWEGDADQSLKNILGERN
jgi:hypothetical protein